MDQLGMMVVATLAAIDPHDPRPYRNRTYTTATYRNVTGIFYRPGRVIFESAIHGTDVTHDLEGYCNPYFCTEFTATPETERADLFYHPV